MNSQFVDAQIKPSCALVEDDATAILQFVDDLLKVGRGCALVTLVDIGGSAARSLGAQMAVAEDGAYCGFVSGGCVEAIVAREAMLAIAAQRDRQLRLGKGSDYFDVVLPCGGSILLFIHVVRNSAAIRNVLAAHQRRHAAGLAYDPVRCQLTAIAIPNHAQRCSGWDDDVFVTVYPPALRLLVCGTGLEAAMLDRAAGALGIEIISGLDREPVDEFSAIIMLYHDLDRETRLLGEALCSTAFYIGCLGSRKTHQLRCNRLREEGVSEEKIAAIRAPIGLFGPTRDARSLAVSILAEILSARNAAVRR
ncbi:XdhC family protein [Brucella pituitosa]|uniref:XdhC family protein n=1 Tax=Brucella pituitosa TaxID=571256 RepID=UPI0009A23D0F|nr:XdhC family protein [Brucella pituitosa]